MIRLFRGGFAAFALLTLGLSDAACAQGTTTINALPSATTPLTGSETLPVWQLGATKKVDANHLLPNSGVTAGTYGDATHCPYLTITADGRVTSATNSTSCAGGGGATPGNPTATIGATAVNGVAPTFMRSDAAPALPATLPALDGSLLTNLNGSAIASGTVPVARLPVGTTGAAGILRPDGSTITVSGGVISAVGGGGATGANPTATIGATAVNGVATTFMRSDAAPALPATLPALNGSNLTNLTAANLTGALPAISGASLTSLTPANLSGAVPINKGGTNCTAGAVACLTAVGGLTGTPSSSTYLRGDGSWAAAGGGSGITDLTLGSGLCSSTTNPIVAGGATVSWCQTVNAQSGTTYTVLSSDGGKFVTFANAGSIAVTLPQATGSFASGWGSNFYNNGAGTATITPTTSNIAGLTSIGLAPGQGVSIASDGTNYDAVVGLPLIANNRFFGNNSGATSYGNVMTGTQATALLDTFTSGAKGLAPASGGGTTNFLRADGTWAAPPGGGSGCSVTGTQFQILIVNLAGTGCDANANASANAGALTLGGSGTLGQITLGNTTSGTINLRTVTGALGTVTASLPANTGTIAELNLAQTWTAAQRNNVATVTAVSNTYTPNFDGSNNFTLTLAATNTIANPSTTPVAGQSGIIEIIQDATGSRTVTWGSQYVAAGGVASLTLSTAANAKDYLSYYVVDSTHILVSMGALNAVH